MINQDDLNKDEYFFLENWLTFKNIEAMKVKE